MPFASEAQRKAMYAAAEGKSTLGIPEAVGKKFVEHRNDEDGEAAVIDAPEVTEYEVMQRIRDGELASPQKYGNVWLFAIRVSGTGYAERPTGEIAHKSPADYLTNEFLARCNGLPVIWEHPDDKLLDSDSFRSQIVGTSSLPYISGDEVWTISRIYDDEAAQLMLDNQLSTSPAVSVSKSAVKLDKVLIEGKPVYVDHIAICSVGVWDKGADPTGVRLDSIEEEMPMAEKKVDPLERIFMKLEELDARLSRVDAKYDEPHNKMDSEEDETKDCADSDDLSSEEKKEVKEEIKKAHHTVDSDKEEDKADSEEEEEEKKADSDEEEEEKKADSKEEDEKEKADSAAIRSLRKELEALKAENKRRAASVDEREAIAKALARADSVAMALGETASVSHVLGETALDLRKRLAKKFSKFSEKGKSLSLGKMDESTFAVIEDMIYADAFEYAKAPAIVPGSVHMMEQRGFGGQVMYVPSANSDPHGWMDAFSNGVQFKGGFLNNRG